MEVDMDAIKVRQFLEAGTYYCVVVEAGEVKGDMGDPGIELRLAALHPTADAGRTIGDRLWGSGEHAGRLKVACKALGLRTSGQKVTITGKDFVGKMCWVKVAAARAYTDRHGVKKDGFPQIAYDGYSAEAAPANIAAALAAVTAEAKAGGAPF